MIINRRIDGTATMICLFVFKIVVLNNTFPSSIYDVVAVLQLQQLLRGRFLHFNNMI